MLKSAGEQYQARLKRIEDAIQLKVPDRVPVILETSYFPAKYTGEPFEIAYNDYDKWLAATLKTARDYNPDMVHATPFFPGKVWEYLEPTMLVWPGHGVSPYHSHQFVEGEYMKEDEYDAFLRDYSDFILRYYFPRISVAMEPFKMLPSLPSFTLGYRMLPPIAEALANPEVSNAIESLLKAGKEMAEWHSKIESFDDEIEKLGFPIYMKGSGAPPFDLISDNLRGMKGTMLDMYRQPDKLLETCEMLLPSVLERSVSAAKKSGNPRIFIALHRGADGFMSLKQFEKFYWPTLKKYITGLIEEELTPCVFFEGDYTSRLEYLLELPIGKVLGHFDSTDVFRAKEVLKGHMCIRGNVPSSLLLTGTPQDIEVYCKELIDVVGEDGGLIVSPRSSIDEVKPENLKAMVEFTQTYGLYK